MIDVEPRLRHELERWQPLEDVPRRWDDVLGRAGEDHAAKRRRPAPRVIVVAVAVIVLLVGGTAYAIAREFVIGEPAPPEVKEQAVLLNEVKGELIPRIPEGPGIRVEETRLAASLDASTGPVYLWAAPTKAGGYCLFVQIVGTEQPDGRPNLGGGCAGGRPIESTASGTRVRDGRWLALVYGRVDPPIVRVVLERDGEALEVPLSSRFFLFELPDVADGESPTLAVVAYDAAGREVVRQNHGARAGIGMHSPRPIDVTRDQPLLEIETSRTKQPVRLYVVDREGKRCVVLITPGGTSTGCGGRVPERREISVAPNQIGTAPRGMLLLWGEVGRDIERLELRFEDGRVEQLPLVEQFTLYQIAPRDYVVGRRPVVIAGRGASDEVVAERRLGPWRR